MQHLPHQRKGKVNPNDISMMSFLGLFQKKNIFDVPGKAARDADT